MNKWFALTVLVLACGSGGYVFLDKAEAADAPPAMKPAVSVIKLAPKFIKMQKQYPARIAPIKQVLIRPQVDGVITDILFSPGAFVKKGQPLYQIESSRYKAKLASAEAELTRIESNISFLEARMKRYSSLVKNGAVSQQDYEDVKTQLDDANAERAVARAEVDTARVESGFTKVYATIDGQASRTYVAVGALATAHQEEPLTVLTEVDLLYVDIQLSSKEALEFRMRYGVHAEFPLTVDIGSDTVPFNEVGKLRFSEPFVSKSTGSVSLRGVIKNPDKILLPGMFVKTTVDLGEEEVLLVPQRASTRNPDGSLIVWALDKDGVAQPRPVKVRAAYEDQWIVSSGVQTGDTIIMTGYQKIRPGTAVAPSDWTPSPPKTQE